MTNDLERARSLPYPDDEFLRRAVTWPVNAQSTEMPRWSCVRMMFGTGSGVGTLLCLRFGMNPDDMIAPTNPRDDEGAV